MNADRTAGEEGSSQAYDKKRAEVFQSAAAKIGKGDVKGGRADAESLLTQNSNDVEAVRTVAVSYLFEKEYKKAERLYLRAANLDPTNTRLQDEVSIARTLQKTDDEVLTLARRELKSPGHRDNGLRLLKHLSDRSPDSAEAYLAMADGFSAARRPPQVLGALHEALRCADGERIDDVVIRVKELAKEYPNVGLPHNLLGRALQKAGCLDEAVAELEAAVDCVPSNIAYRTDLAVGYASRALNRLASGDTAGARMDVDAAKGISPIDPVVAEATARVAAYEARRDVKNHYYNAALVKLSVAKHKSPDDTEFEKELSSLYICVAAHFEGEGDDAVALSSYTRALELDPESTTVRKKVAELSYSQGLEAITANDYDRAITLLEEAYSTYRASSSYVQELANAYDLRGQLRVTLGKLELAVDDFERGISVDPANTSLSAHYSAAAQALGS